MKFYTEKKGFTLVEILIVIMIVGALSTLAVNGYTQYRTSTLFGLAVDNLASKVYEMRSKAIYGTGSGNNYEHIKGVLAGDSEVPPLSVNQAKCYGVLWTKNADGVFSSQFFDQNFESRKMWIGDKWSYVGCGDMPEESDFRLLEKTDAQFFIKDIKVGDLSRNSVMVRFLPPSGAFELKADNEAIMTATDLPSLKMEAVYGVVDSTKKKIVDFNLVRNSYNSTDAEVTQ